MLSPLQNSEFRARYGENYIKQYERQATQFLTIVRLYLKRQRDRVLDSLDNRVKSLEDEVFNLNLEIQLAKTEFLPFLEDILIRAGASAMLFQGSDFNFNLSSQLATTLSKRVDLFTRSINETTFSKLKSEFTESFAEGETRDKLIKRVENVYGDISKGRAQTIARTEVQVANQTGIFGGYKQAGAQIKIWVWAPGIKGGVRDNHAAIDGEEQPIDTPFSNGLMYPGEASGSAGEVINCQCTI